MKLVEELLTSGLVVLDVYVDTDWQVPDDLAARLEDADVDIRRLATGGIERIASTTSPQPIVAEALLPDTDWSAASDPTSALVAVDINDPGNVGTLARSAVAAGFDAILVLGETADAFGPKTLRASAGAMFRVPVVVQHDVADGLDAVASLGMQRVGTRMADADPCDEVDLSGPVALVLGSEAHGLGDEYSELIDRWVHVPMAGSVESLNVAMAGTILTYEIGRQRRQAD